MHSKMSAYERPQREVLSLKTSDIPGAMGKSKIYEKKLVYNVGNGGGQPGGDGAEGNGYSAQDYHNSQFYGRDRRMYEQEPDPNSLPDPYELEQMIRNGDG